MPKSRKARQHRRQRWTSEQARTVLSSLRESGLSPGAFAAREGVDVKRLYWWRQRLGGGSAPGAGARPTAFIELRGMAPPAMVEVVLPSGLTLRVAETIDGAALRRLVEAVASSC
jgi:transposase